MASSEDTDIRNDEQSTAVDAARGVSLIASQRSRHWLAISILLIHAILVAWGATRLSPTWDETGHLVAGVTHWRFERFDLYSVNPPLPRLIGTLPILFTDFDIAWDLGKRDRNPYQRNEVKKRHGRMIIQKYGSDSMRYFVIARWMMIPFSLLGGWVCYRWANDLFGRGSSFVALTLWCFSPSILGNAQLFTTDVPAAAFCLAAAYTFWIWLRDPSWSTMLNAGIVLSVALLCKMSLVVLLPAFLGWWVLQVMFRRIDRVGVKTLQVFGVLVIALMLTNLCYLFDGSFKQLKKYTFYSNTLAGPNRPNPDVTPGNRFQGSLLGEMPVPLPEDYVVGIDTQKSYFDKGQSVFLNGEWHYRGTYLYYVYCMLYKWPLGTLVLLGVTVIVTIGIRRYRQSIPDELFLLFPAVILFVLVSMNININKHIRYALPVFPFLFVWISKLGMAFQLRDRLLSFVTTLGLVGLVVSSLTIYPHSVAFFNVTTGGPTQGHYYLDGTAIDWAQDLNYLKAWIDSHPESFPIGVAQSGLYTPQEYGIECVDVPKGAAKSDEDRPENLLGPLPGWYAVSVRSIHGIKGEYLYFLEFEPEARAGYSIYIYHLGLEEVNQVRKKLGLAEISVPPESESAVNDE